MKCHVCNDTKLVSLFTGTAPCTDCPPEPALRLTNDGPPRTLEGRFALVQPPGTDVGQGFRLVGGSGGGSDPADAAASRPAAGLDKMLAMVGAEKVIRAGDTAALEPALRSPFFEPHYAMLIVTDYADFAMKRPAQVVQITCHGRHQEDWSALGWCASEAYAQWIRIPWGSFSMPALGYPLSFLVANCNPQPIRAELFVRGRPLDRLPDLLGVPRPIK